MIKVYGHPRSGNNYLSALIAKNIYPTKNLKGKDGYVGHWADRAFVRGSKYAKLFGGHGLPRRYKNLKPHDCYIYRDGRDIALSFWHSEHFVNPEWTKTLTFSQFIRKPLDWVSSPGDKADPGLTIFQHWKRHLNLWAGAGVHMVCYEELKQNPEQILAEIAQIAGIKRFVFKPINKRIGWFPSNSSGWHNHYTDDDLEYFYSIAKNCYGVYDA